MTATNHGLMGIVLAAYLPLPIAIPLAFVSHFVLDISPHYGIPERKRNKSKQYKTIVTIDTLIAILLFCLTAYKAEWRLFAAGMAAYSPDMLWAFEWFTHHHNLRFKPRSRFMRFHKKIQHYERPWGIYIELALFAVLAPLSLRAILK